MPEEGEEINPEIRPRDKETTDQRAKRKVKEWIEYNEANKKKEPAEV